MILYPIPLPRRRCLRDSIIGHNNRICKNVFSPMNLAIRHKFSVNLNQNVLLLKTKSEILFSNINQSITNINRLFKILHHHQHLLQHLLQHEFSGHHVHDHVANQNGNHHLEQIEMMNEKNVLVNFHDVFF